MNTLKIAGSIILSVIAVWVCIRYRRLLLIQRGAVTSGSRSVMVTLCKSLLGGLLCVALLAGASWAGFYAVTTLPERVRNAFYTFLPIIVLTSYVYPIFQFKNLPKEWKRSPLFILAMLPPILGGIVMIGVLWCEVDRPR